MSKKDWVTLVQMFLEIALFGAIYSFIVALMLVAWRVVTN